MMVLWSIDALYRRYHQWQTKLATFVIFELHFVERCVMVIDSKDKTLLIGKKGDIC